MSTFVQQRVGRLVSRATISVIMVAASLTVVPALVGEVEARCIGSTQSQFTSNGGTETYAVGTCNGNGSYTGAYRSNDGSCKFVDINGISFSPACTSGSSWSPNYSFTGYNNSLRICTDVSPYPMICGSWYSNTGF